MVDDDWKVRGGSLESTGVSVTVRMGRVAGDCGEQYRPLDDR
jgi:hypothetical protein